MLSLKRTDALQCDSARGQMHGSMEPAVRAQVHGNMVLQEDRCHSVNLQED